MISWGASELLNPVNVPNDIMQSSKNFRLLDQF